MGEIADMMLEGTLCAGCGEYLGNDNGFPEYCAGCQADDRKEDARREEIAKKAAGNIAALVMKELEKAFKAPFEPGVGEHFKKNIYGLMRGMYVDHHNLITHAGMAATLDNNRQAQRRAEQRRKKTATI